MICCGEALRGENLVTVKDCLAFDPGKDMPRFCQDVLAIGFGLKNVGPKGLMLLLLLLVTNLSLIFFLDFLGRGCLAFTGSFRLGVFVFLVFVFLVFFLGVIRFRFINLLPSHRIRLLIITPPKNPPPSGFKMILRFVS